MASKLHGVEVDIKVIKRKGDPIDDEDVNKQIGTAELITAEQGDSNDINHNSGDSKSFYVLMKISSVSCNGPFSLGLLCNNGNVILLKINVSII